MSVSVTIMPALEVVTPAAGQRLRQVCLQLSRPGSSEGLAQKARASSDSPLRSGLGIAPAATAGAASIPAMGKVVATSPDPHRLSDEQLLDVRRKLWENGVFEKFPSLQPGRPLEATRSFKINSSSEG